MTPILLSDLIHIKPPQAPSKKPVSDQLLHDVEVRGGQLSRLCLQLGVMGDEEAREFAKETGAFLARVADLQRRLQLTEAIDGEDVWDLRYKWKDGVTGFLKFRDLVRDTLNTLQRAGLITVIAGDAIKAELDRFFLQVIEIDDCIQNLLKQL